jgi:hypothetical protein
MLIDGWFKMRILWLSTRDLDFFPWRTQGPTQVAPKYANMPFGVPATSLVVFPNITLCLLVFHNHRSHSLAGRQARCLWRSSRRYVGSTRDRVQWDALRKASRRECHNRSLWGHLKKVPDFDTSMGAIFSFVLITE